MSTENFSAVLVDSSDPFGQSTLFNLLQDSLNREKELKRKLDEQLKENDRLKLELEMERMKPQVNLKSFSDLSEESEIYVHTSFVNDTDLKETFGTNSSLLMQFKYDDLQHSYSKCVRKLMKKTNQLKKVLREAEIEKFMNVQLTDKNRELNKKIEQVCFRFFDLMDQRSEELTVLKNHTDELKLKLLFALKKLECREKSSESAISDFSE